MREIGESYSDCALQPGCFGSQAFFVDLLRLTNLMTEPDSTRLPLIAVTGLASANLWLRSADRVQLVIGRFEAFDFGELFDRTRELPWEQWLGRFAKFPVRGRSVRSQLHSVPDCQRIVKKAIVERLKDCYEVDWLEETGNEYAIDVAVIRNEVTLTIDTTGEALNRRGYRKLTAKAPLRETLAAALVQLSVWRPDRPFVDPFCGSVLLQDC